MTIARVGNYSDIKAFARAPYSREKRRFPLGREATGRRRAGIRNLNRARQERERERDMIGYPAEPGGFARVLTRPFHAYACVRMIIAISHLSATSGSGDAPWPRSG